MKLLVSDEIIKATTSCEKGFSCLNGDSKDICEMVPYRQTGVCFIKCKNDNCCAYKKAFGEQYYCACPVRKEIYDKHRI